jgi:hypothetical protein
VRPNLRSRLHFSHNQEGDHEVRDGHVVALENNNNDNSLLDGNEAPVYSAVCGYKQTDAFRVLDFIIKTNYISYTQ